MDLLPNLTWCNTKWGYPEMNKDTLELLQQCIGESDLGNQSDSIESLIERSKAFPIPFPIDSPRLLKLKDTRSTEQLQKNIRSTYTLIHSRVLVLMARFLVYKRQFGTPIEKELYKDMTIPNFIERILKKRASVFMGTRDRYQLLSGEKGADGWENIGRSDEKAPLKLSSCLSYDEMKISAFVYISGYTECINDGSRRNAGVPSDDAQPTARIIGLIGPRFKRQGRMDYEDAIISKVQNSSSNGYGQGIETTQSPWKRIKKNNSESDRAMWRQLWSEFYQVPSYTYDELIEKVPENLTNEKFKERFVPVKDKVYRQSVIFDNEVFYKRIRILAECTLLEADSVAAEEGNSAYINIVGCGLGVWRISNHQNDVYVLTFLERIKQMLEDGLLQHVSDINFSYLSNECALFKDGEKMFIENKNHPRGGISVSISNREPSARLQSEHENKLLVITYPWDSNAHPGNEFWIKKLTSSGDPAAACSTQITELHNAHINPHVNGYNVRVAGNFGIKPMTTFCAELLRK